MRWEDERYVRIYTRDSVDWLGLSFIAQGLFCLILRKVDRAGLLKLGKHGKRAVAIVIGFPGDWPRLEPALEELLADGCVQIRGEYLVVPNFIEAQEATQSDAQRKRESRGRARDVAAAAEVLNPDKTSDSVTPGHESGQEVTSGHKESQLVTPNHAVPCRAEPSEETLPSARVTRLPTRDEAYSAKYPRSAALIASLAARGKTALWATKSETRTAVEEAIGTQSVEAVADRVAWSLDATGKPWLGHHLDAIRPPKSKARGDLDSIPWNQRLSHEEHRQATAELRALATLDPDLESAPLGIPGNPDSPAYEAIRELNAKWRAVAEARS